MLHIMISGNSAITNSWEKRMNKYIAKMPDGKFLNLHNDEIDHCCGIALLNCGDIVALYPRCTLNKLIMKHDEEMVKLSTSAMSDFTRKAGQTWKDAVDCHNATSDEYNIYNDIILAYYIFDRYEDVPPRKDETSTGIDEIGKMRETFFKNHAARMDALNKVFKEATEGYDEVDAQIDASSKQLDELLADMQ